MEAVTVQEKALVRRVTWRLIPFLFLLYVIAYLDRSNVGFAKLNMKEMSWFSESAFGTGAGIFFLGYFLFEIPSNLLLEGSARANGSRASCSPGARSPWR